MIKVKGDYIPLSGIISHHLCIVKWGGITALHFVYIEL